MQEENKVSAWLPIMIIAGAFFWVFVIWYANGLRINNIEKNKKIEELQKYKCAWEEFNRTHIPETALPRIKEIEAIYLKG